MNHTAHRRHGFWRVTWRFFTGAHLDGDIRTDAGWFVAGTRALTRTGRATRWAMRPRLYRAAVRLGTITTAAAGTAAYVAAPVVTTAAAEASAAGGAAYATLRTVRAVRLRRHTRTVVRPLAAVLAGQLGMPATTRPAELVTVPVDYRTPDYDRPDSGVVRVMLPATLPDTAALREAITRTVSGKLGIGARDLDVTWHLAGAAPSVTYRAAPRPPARVKVAEVAGQLDAATGAAPLLGIGARGRAVSVDLDDEAPHLAVSAGTGAGKSILLRGLIAQWLHHGVQVVICDPKQISQAWCRDLPGVTYARTGEQMHNAIVDYGAECGRRYDTINTMPVDQETGEEIGPRMVLVFEEQNVGAPMLAEYWASVRGPGDPKRSPAFSALDYALCAGRAARMHVVSVAQYLTVSATGGNPAARENYGARILARATVNAWKMLAPEHGPRFPHSSRKKGRLHLALADELTEVQSILWTVAEAREYATSGAAVTVPATWGTVPGQRDNRGPVTPGPDLVTLAEAARRGVVPLTYAALRQRKARAGAGFPAGRELAGGTRWDAAELAAWWAAEVAGGAELAEDQGVTEAAGQ